MYGTTRPLRGRKLLVGAVGIGTLTFVACGLFPGCNLAAPAPAPCPGSETYSCYEMPDLTTPKPAADASPDAAPGDGSVDAMAKGD